MNITDPIRARANAGASGPAIIAGDATIGYRHFERMLDRIAGHALAEGLGPGQGRRAGAHDAGGIAFVLPLALARIGGGDAHGDKRCDRPRRRRPGSSRRRGALAGADRRLRRRLVRGCRGPRVAARRVAPGPRRRLLDLPDVGHVGRAKSVAVTHAMMGRASARRTPGACRSATRLW
jgi:hypothetical protein